MPVHAVGVHVRRAILCLRTLCKKQEFACQDIRGTTHVMLLHSTPSINAWAPVGRPSAHRIMRRMRARAFGARCAVHTSPHACCAARRRIAASTAARRGSAAEYPASYIMPCTRGAPLRVLPAPAAGSSLCVWGGVGLCGSDSGRQHGHGPIVLCVPHRDDVVARLSAPTAVVLYWNGMAAVRCLHAPSSHRGEHVCRPCAPVPALAAGCTQAPFDSVPASHVRTALAPQVGIRACACRRGHANHSRGMQSGWCSPRRKAHLSGVCVGVVCGGSYYMRACT